MRTYKMPMSRLRHLIRESVKTILSEMTPNLNLIRTDVMSDELRDWLIDRTMEEHASSPEIARDAIKGFNKCKNGTPLPEVIDDDVEDEDDMTPAQQVTSTLEYFFGSYPNGRHQTITKSQIRLTV